MVRREGVVFVCEVGGEGVWRRVGRGGAARGGNVGSRGETSSAGVVRGGGVVCVCEVEGEAPLPKTQDGGRPWIRSFHIFLRRCARLRLH